MTEGKPLKLVVSFFIPLLLGNLFQQLYNMVDSIVVGKGINDQALAAVGSTSSINFFIFGFVIGLTNGIAILMAQAFGAKEYDRLCRVIAMSVVLCFAVAITMSIISFFGGRWILLKLKTPPVILEDALIYIKIIYVGIIVTVANNICVSLLRALGDSKTPLIAIAGASVLNLVLDIVLIIGFKTGVAGAAYATVFAQLCSVFYCVGRLRKIEVLQFKKRHWKIDLPLISQLFKMGIPVAIMNSITAIGGMALQYYVNILGAAYTAAYSACMKLLIFFEQPGMNMGFTISTFAGQNLGAKKVERIGVGLRKCVIISTGINIVLGAMLILIPEQLASIMLSDPTIIAHTKEFLPIGGMFIWILGFLFIFRSASQGMGHTVIPMLSGIVELILRIAVVLIVRESFGFAGIAIAEVSSWTGAALMLMIYYFHVISFHQKQVVT